VRELTPREVVAELDRYIIGQRRAKRAVAIAIRNRWRRQNVPEELRDEVTPKNIIMIGPTGVGKTEIARRLANLVEAPFLKVEASKYTEVGYHGRDVESMVRDLVDVAVSMARRRARESVEGNARLLANERLLDVLLPKTEWEERSADTTHSRARELMRQRLEDGRLEERVVEIQVEEKAIPTHVFTTMGMDQPDIDLQGLFDKILPSRTQKRKVTVADARRILTEQEADKLIDAEKTIREGLVAAEQSGIIFIDEIDKISGRGSEHGPDVSRQGVQRDMLPIVEGCAVPTRHGMVHTHHILFVAAGAFHMTKPADLIPELQGRFPIRVELDELGHKEFVRILTEPQNALVKQYTALMATEGVELRFTDDAIDQIARYAHSVNTNTQNIGARRLYTVVEKLLEEASFEAPEHAGESLTIDGEYVRARLADIITDEDMSRYIL